MCSSTKSQFNVERRNFLSLFESNRLIACKQRLVQGDISVVAEIVFLESQLRTLTLRDLEGAKIRSRAKMAGGGREDHSLFL